MSDPIPLQDLHKHLRPVGVYQGPQSFPQHLVNTRKMQFSKAASLADLTADYEFFTPGLLYSKIPNAPDLTASFIEETKKSTIPFSLSFDRALFGGMETWNNVLFGIEKEYWQEYVAFLGTVALQHRETKVLWRVRLQTVDVPDPYKVHSRIIIGSGAHTVTSEARQLVEITSLWLESSKGSWYLQPGWLPTAMFSREAVFPDTVRFTQSLFKERQNPYGDSDDPNTDPAFRSGG